MWLSFLTSLLPALEPPRLLVLISIDQCIPEQLERLAPHFEGGLGRLVRGGASFPEAALGYARTSTGPGHGTLATGCQPRTHGLIGNEFWARAERRAEYCVGDAEARLVTRAGMGEPSSEGRSPRNLLAPTLGDRMKAAFPGCKVVSIAGKDRSAIAMGGHDADTVVWWYRGKQAGFATGDHYATALPDWAERWNEVWPQIVSRFVWEPSYDLQQSPAGTAPDDREQEGKLGLRERVFPYVVPELDDPTKTSLEHLAAYAFKMPLVDLFVARAAGSAVLAELLGADEIPDLLALSFSACDVVGHNFGPYSVETTDVLLRLDRELGSLFKMLDRQVGEGRWVAALSADHGVLPLPGAPTPDSQPIRRVTAAEIAAQKAAVKDALKARYGEAAPGSIYLTSGFAIDEREALAANLDPAEVRRVAAEAALEMDWVIAAYTYEDLLSDEPTQDPFLALHRESAHAERSPDVQLVYAPRVLESTYATGTSHGTPHAYDRRVPLVFLGPTFPAGQRPGPASSVDVVPTLLALLGIALEPPLDGRVLEFEDEDE